jgi:hypothetical protein
VVVESRSHLELQPVIGLLHTSNEMFVDRVQISKEKNSISFRQRNVTKPQEGCMMNAGAEFENSVVAVSPALSLHHFLL